MNNKHYKGFKQELIETEIEQIHNFLSELPNSGLQSDIAKTLYNTLERVYNIGYREGSIDECYNHPDVGC